MNPTASTVPVTESLDPADFAKADAERKRKDSQTVQEVNGRKMIEVMDLDGVVHKIPTLRNRDLEDVEVFCGGWKHFWDDERKVQNFNYLIWCSARNEGRTKAQRINGEWACTIEESKDAFGGSVTNLMMLIVKILNATGFETKAESGADGEAAASGPLEPTGASATGGTSTPAPAQ